MSYDNAVPKPLKFLVSDGKMIDDQGNVIAESDTLKDLYTKWNPEVKKYLLSDGSVVDENNNLIIKNDYYKKMYDQADPKVAKYLHADGTIDENPGTGGGGSTISSGDIELPIFETQYRQNMFIVLDENKNIIDSLDKLSNGKWWLDFEFDTNNMRNCYTESNDDYPYYTNAVNELKDCTITITDDYSLTIKDSSNNVIVDNLLLQLNPRKIGSVIGISF